MYENDALSGQYQKESFHLFHIMNLIQISQKIVFIYIYSTKSLYNNTEQRSDDSLWASPWQQREGKSPF